jgi:hypothetical protein
VQHISLTHGFGKVSLDHAVVIVHEEMRSLYSSSTHLLVCVRVMEFACVHTSRSPSLLGNVCGSLGAHTHYLNDDGSNYDARTRRPHTHEEQPHLTTLPYLSTRTLPYMDTWCFIICGKKVEKKCLTLLISGENHQVLFVAGICLHYSYCFWV